MATKWFSSGLMTGMQLARLSMVRMSGLQLDSLLFPQDDL